MARYFLDSSALIKRYHQSGTTLVEALFSEQGNRFFVSRLALVEIHSAFARLVREGLISPEHFGTLIARLEADVATGSLIVAAVSSSRLARASALLAANGLIIPMRTLDTVHLATAEALHRRSRLAKFVASDKQLLAAATVACGLDTLDVG